jgi:hypothetical protein
MSVTGEITKHMMRTAEGGLSIDDPVLMEQGTQEERKAFGFCSGLRDPAKVSWPI